MLADLGEQGKLSCDLQITTKEGSTYEIPFLNGETGSGNRVFSQNVFAPEGRLFFMVISAEGNASVGGYELTFTEGVEGDD